MWCVGSVVVVVVGGGGVVVVGGGGVRMLLFDIVDLVSSKCYCVNL